jgi:DNA polymerase III sliding clamp (beta) subunit (PCNA family)
MKLPQVKNVTWPTVARPNNLHTVLVPAERFQYMIEQVQFTITTDSPHPYGAVGYIHRPEPSSIRLVGTDGFRLSYCEIALDSMPDEFLKTGLCLSKRALSELQKICAEGFETISLSIGDDQKTLIAEVPGYYVHLRLVNVNYPNYQGVIPAKHPQSIKLPRAGIQSMARRVLLAADKSRSLHLKFETDRLTLSSHTVGESEGQETLGLDDYKGPQCGISLNGRYLNDIISTTSSNQLVFGFKNEDQPVVIAPAAEPAACKSTHVLVPMRETH